MKDIIPKLIPISKPHKLQSPFYSSLSEYRYVTRLVVHHIRRQALSKQERHFYFKHSKVISKRRAKHAGAWYSKDSEKLQK